MPRTDLAELVAEAAGESPDRLALVEAAGRSLTWASLDDEAGRVASGLGEVGIVAGNRVVIALANRLEFVTSYVGVLRAQAVAVPVNPGSTATELARMIADSGARLVVAEPASLAAVREAVTVVAAALDGVDTDLTVELLTRAVAPRVVVVAGDPEGEEVSYSALVTAPARPVPPLPDPEKLAALLYTSGTSGPPRAAMLTHRALLANLDQIARVEPALVNGDDVVLGILPLFHVYGLNVVLGSALWHRAKLVLADRFEPQATLNLIDDEACSVVPVAPGVFAHWLPLGEELRDRLGSVRLMLSGSAPLTSEVTERFAELTGITVHQGYGLTEAAPVVTSTLRSEHPQPGSLGGALDGMELRLVDDLGRPPEGGDPGEIEIRGPNLFSGYWPDGSGGPDPEGWWATGDVGFLDATGDLFLVDRVRELVVVSGFNVYPHEVEDVVREVPGVREAAVIGVPDDETGEAVVAYVVAPDTDPAVVEAAVRQRCAAGLARFKQPARVEVVAQLPLTVTGKVQKGRLRWIERRRAEGLIE